MGKGVFQQHFVLCEESRWVGVSSNKARLCEESRPVRFSSNKIVSHLKTVGG